MPPRPTRLPGKDFAAESLPVLKVKAFKGLRVHSDPWPAIGFRTVAAHRFSHPDAPAGLMYLGEDIETCLWECFGDHILDPGAKISRAKWVNSRASEITAKKTLSICDLTDLATRRHLKLDLPALNHTDISIPQQWGLAIQTHSAEVDGLYYPSRFTGRRCLVLFERPKIETKIGSKKGELLSDIDEASNFLAQNTIHLV
jgi:hypothetical protein